MESSNKSADADRRQAPGTAPELGEPGEARGVEPGIADADKATRARTGREEVRNTPPAGHWNDTSAD